jgi:hypothetical protein
MDNFKIIIKPLKKKVVEIDPIKIQALKEKRKLQRQIKKDNKPISEEVKIPKIKIDHSDEIENINKTLKNLIGFSIDEINDKLKTSKTSTVQLGNPSNEVKEIKKERKKKI